MFDILLYLFESYFDLGSYPDHEKLSLKLTAAGFEEEDINQALTWLTGLQKLNRTEYPERINRGSFRVYTETEEQYIGLDGVRFLAFWEHNKFITAIEREMVLDRVLALGRKNLPLDKLKLVVLMVLWSQHEDLDPLLIEDLLTPADMAHAH